MKWFRLYSEIKDDPKMLSLTDHQFRIWINLMALANETDQRGVIPRFPLRGLAAALHTTEEALSEALALFQEPEFRMIQILDDQSIFVINFEKRNYDKPSDTPEATRERKRRQREKEKQNVTPEDNSVTPVSRDVTLHTNTNTYTTEKDNTPLPPNMDKPKGPSVSEVIDRYSRYNSGQLTIIRSYWEMIRFTRKTGQVAASIVAKEMDYWERFDSDMVISALNTHLQKYQAKQEDYTRGIIRRLQKEQEMGVKFNGFGAHQQSSRSVKTENAETGPPSRARSSGIV